MVAISAILASAVAITGVIQGAVADHVVVTGVTTGGIQPRYELRDMEANHHVMFNLFLQALEAFQHEDQNDKASYYGVASIHGVPYRSWDGVGQSGSGGGYCAHTSNLFGPWHRPYIALYEQRLAFYARKVAAKFPAGKKRKMYEEAAHKFRLPYWDWAKKGARDMPKSVVTPKIKVTRPNGKTVSIKNPLYSYSFHPVTPNNLLYAPENSWHESKRNPQPPKGAHPKSNNAKVEAGFKTNRASFESGVYALMTQGGHYNKISNNGQGHAGNNFEGIHNSIHYGFGTNSYMQIVPLSSYDPIFWLHHANVDRLLAIWQFLHPQTYTVPTNQDNGGTWFYKAGSTQGPNSPLKPFHRTKSAFWTPNSARYHKTFHYTYPELAGNPTKAGVRAKMNHQYGSAAGVSAASATKLKVKRDVGNFTNTVPEVNIVLDVSPDETLVQYSTNISMPLALNDGPYSVMVFLGDISTTPDSWMSDPNLVGFQATLGNLGPTAGSTSVRMTASVYLTQSILAKYVAGELEALDKDTVSAYLKDNLHWRIEQNGERIEHADTDIEVHLMAQEVTAAVSDEDFPNYLGMDHIAPINATAPGEMGM